MAKKSLSAQEKCNMPLWTKPIVEEEQSVIPTYCEGEFRRIFARILISGLMVASPATVWANFQVCNQTLDVVNVSIGAWDTDAWETSGWWTVGPNQCANVIESTLTSRYIYVYARDVFNASMLAGDISMCVDPGEFRIRGREDCLIRGHIAARFEEVDTRRSERWTFFIRAPAQ